MPKARKSIAALCDGLTAKHSALGKKQKSKLGIYVGSLKERLLEVEYACDQIKAYSSQQIVEATTGPPRQRKREFYTTCFWAFSYSVFDILAHVVNTIHPAISDESKVSFLGAKNGYQNARSTAKTNHTLPNNIKDAIFQISNRTYFKHLHGYRQCGLHRRAVCTREEYTTSSVSAPYTTSAATDDWLVTLICDDTDNLKPKFSQRRSLCDETAMITKGMDEDIRKLLRLL